MKTLLVLAMLAAAAFPASAEQRLTIYDARRDTKAAAITSSEAAFLDRKVRPAVRRANAGRPGCEDEFGVIDRARGALTRAGAVQTVFLYRDCITGHGFGVEGLAVVEDGRLVRHLIFEGGSSFALGIVPDLNGDGLAELIIAGGTTGQGITVSGFKLISLTTPVRNLGIASEVYSDDCGATEKGRILAQRISVETGPAPRFFRETFRQGGCSSSGKWTKISGPDSFALEKDETTFVDIR